ncbi:MAG: murein L,D-transpeptidase catalytic domain family protein [Myxococcota bacterium]
MHDEGATEAFRTVPAERARRRPTRRVAQNGALPSRFDRALRFAVCRPLASASRIVPLLFVALLARDALAESFLRPLSSSRTRVARLVAAGVPETPLRHALAALDCARARGLVDGSTLTLIDYSRPSSVRRLWVIDPVRGRVRFHEFVAHGRNSGEVSPVRFSNEPGSLQSSLGLFRTAETYIGRHGYSLRLDGLEPGVNDHARERAIVMHGAEYVTEKVASHFGRVGRSWGCPAIDAAIHRELIDEIRGGTALFAYYPDAKWLRHSPYQACERVTAAR